MEKIKCSIIIPVYNAENYLEDCLTSVVNQTLKEIEIICVNDGSSDNSLDILNKFAEKDKRIIVINKDNDGQSVARNLAISRAKGEYLGFVDADDWVDLNYFEELYNTAKKHNCDMACAGFVRVRKKKNSIKRAFKKETVITDINTKIKTENIPLDNYVVTNIYKREAWQQANITFPEGRFFEDMAILIKIMFYLGNMVTVPKVMYYYRFVANSTVNMHSRKHNKDMNWARNELYKFAEEHCIKLDRSRVLKKVQFVNLLGIKLFKIIRYETRTKYMLFGFLPIITITDKV